MQINPDANSEVRFGEQSWEEMMIGFFNATLDPKMDPADLVTRKNRRRETEMSKWLIFLTASFIYAPRRSPPSIKTSCRSCRAGVRNATARAKSAPMAFMTLQGDASLGNGDSGGSANEEDAAVVRRPVVRAILERPVDKSERRSTRWPRGRFRRARRHCHGGYPRLGPGQPDGASEAGSRFRMPSAFDVPKAGKVDYQYIVVPTGLTEDKWVQMVEARPSARSVVHHVVVYIREPESKWLRGEAEPGVPFVPPRTTPTASRANDIGGGGSDILTIYTPGNVPDKFHPGQAKLMKAGSDLVFQMHYTANGKSAATDKTSVGLIFANERPAERVLTIALANRQVRDSSGDGNYRVDDRSYKFRTPARC